MLPLTPTTTGRTTSARRPAALLLAAALLVAPALPAAAAVTTPAHAAQPGQTVQAGRAAAGALPATTTNTVTWGLVPATAEGPDGRVSIRLEAEPGQSFTDHVQVQNFSEQEITFALGASDGVVTEDGVFDILPSAVEPVDVGTWVEIQPEVTVPAQGTAIVPFTLTVPEDAIPGDHPGGITASVSTTSADEAGNAVSLDSRVGVRIHLRVAGDLVPQVEIQDLTASYAGTWNPFARGDLTLNWTAANTGNVRIGSAQEAEVSGLFGLPAGADDGPVAQQREILPRQASAQSVTIPAWPMVRLTTDLTAVQNVVGEDVVDAALADARASASVWAVPWPQLVILALLALALLLWRRGRTRKDARLEAALAEAREAGRREAAGSTAAGSTPGSAPAAPTDAPKDA